MSRYIYQWECVQVPFDEEAGDYIAPTPDPVPVPVPWMALRHAVLTVRNTLTHPERVNAPEARRLLKSFK